MNALNLFAGIDAVKNAGPLRIGDMVRIVALHIELGNAQGGQLGIFNRAACRPLRIDGFGSNGAESWLELNVLEDGSQAADYGHHTLCVLLEEVERA